MLGHNYTIIQGKIDGDFVLKTLATSPRPVACHMYHMDNLAYHGTTNNYAWYNKINKAYLLG